MTNREELHQIIDKLPEDKLPRMKDFFRHLFDEDEFEVNEKTKKEIDQARERIKNDDYITLEDLLKEL